MFKNGDIVKHKPTGETWVVLRAGKDSDGDFIEPAGWPPCRARSADCEMVAAGGGLVLFEKTQTTANA